MNKQCLNCGKFFDDEQSNAIENDDFCDEKCELEWYSKN